MSEQLAVVTIDGPSGVGKSTISRMISARLGFTYLDTGAMYRAVALKCKKEGVDVKDEDSVSALLPTLGMELLPAISDKEDTRVQLDGEDVSDQIRTQEISMMASAVSALLPVRDHLTRLQQEMGAAGGIVAEGRDTGTVVFPSAAWKFFLDATPEERATRRIKQLREKGLEVNEQEVLDQIIKRDRDDSERTIAPLAVAEDAVHINSTEMTPAEVVNSILTIVKKK